MEKMMVLSRKTQLNSSDLGVVEFFEGLLEHMDIVTDGIQKIVEGNLGLVGHIINSYDNRRVAIQGKTAFKTVMQD